MLTAANLICKLRPRLSGCALGFLWAGCFLLQSGLGADQSIASVKPERRSVLVLGDSLAAGYGLESGQAFPLLLQEKIAAADLPFEVINAGLSGDTSAGG